MTLHLAAVGALAVVIALRWWTRVTAPVPIDDELIYVGAFAHVARGGSPYEVSGFLSFSLQTYLGAWLMQHFGEMPTLASMRALNLIGVSVATWCATLWLPWSWRGRWIAAALFVTLAPAVRFGVSVGNYSLAAAGMVVLALTVWMHRPLVTGSLLGASVVLKPLAPGAILALFSHRPIGGGRTQLLAGGFALLIVTAIVFGSPELDRALALDVFPRLGRSVAPHRIGHLLGLKGSAIWFSTGAGLLVLFIARRRPLGPTQLMGLAVTSAIAMTPLVWSHTLLVSLPLQAVCLAIAMERYRTRPQHETFGTSRVLEMTIVLLSVAVLQLSEGATNIYDQHPIVQWGGALPVIAAPWVLLTYLLRRTTDI